MNKLINNTIAIRLGWKFTGEKWISPLGYSQFDAPRYIDSNSSALKDTFNLLGVQTSFDAMGWWTQKAYFNIRSSTCKISSYGNWDSYGNLSGCRALLKYIRAAKI